MYLSGKGKTISNISLFPDWVHLFYFTKKLWSSCPYCLLGCISRLLFDPVGVTGIRRGTGFQPVAIFGRAVPTLVVRYGKGCSNTTKRKMSAIASYQAPYGCHEITDPSDYN
ncbi:hypothetical protein BJP36_44080 [Moorena producens JHB]|uniref:Uncharacterized protein n=1 Tax=Moorena producens (strain JHB) TaxID=1454205 RepID=A0A9Q9STG1_MOOP1|nr:hypothetical protein [Moorena producens]WAN69340.1 hypothetical protein BJP36_44080 [Moorena producens JHB]